MAQQEDRYGLQVVFNFESDGAIARIDKVERSLKHLEQTIRHVANTVSKASVGGQIRGMFNGATTGASQATHQLNSTARATNNVASALRPVKSEFRALKAEARNIDFGDLTDVQQFRQARSATMDYVQALHQMEQAIQGNTAAEREFRAELQRQQRVATDRVATMESQRNAAIASKRQGIATGVATAGAAVAAPLIGVGVNSVQTFMGFEDQLLAAKAVMAESDRTQENLDKIRAKAKKLGAETRFSASDAASGFVLLAQAGYSVDKQLAAIDGTLNLAAAGNLDLSRATEITLNTLGQFQLEAGQAAHAADVLAKAAAMGQLDVGDIGETLKYAGVNAQAYGSTLEEVAAMTAVLSKAGIKGEQAGTVERSLFLRLSDGEALKGLNELGVSATDSAGKMRPITDVLGDIGAALQGVSDSDQSRILKSMFGAEALAGGRFLAENAALIRDYTKETQNASQGMGAAESAAKIMEEGVGGAWRSMLSALEGVKIEIAEGLVPMVTAGIRVLNRIFSWFIALPEPVKDTAVKLGMVVGAIATLAAIGGTAASVFFGLQSAIASSAVASTIMRTAALPLTGFFQTAIAGFGASGVSGAIASMGAAFTSAAGTISGFITGALAALTSPIGLTVAAIAALYAALEILTPGFNVLGAVLSAVGGVLGFVYGLVKGLAEGIIFGLTPAISATTTALAPLTSALGGVFGGVGEAVSGAIASFQRMAISGEMLGQFLGRALTAPFWIVPATVDAVIGGIRGMWQGFIDWLTDALLMVPRSVQGAFSKLLPPFMRGPEPDAPAAAIAPSPIMPSGGGGLAMLPTGPMGGIGGFVQNNVVPFFRPPAPPALPSPQTLTPPTPPSAGPTAAAAVVTLPRLEIPDFAPALNQAIAAVDMSAPVTAQLNLSEVPSEVPPIQAAIAPIAMPPLPVFPTLEMPVAPVLDLAPFTEAIAPVTVEVSAQLTPLTATIQQGFSFQPAIALFDQISGQIQGAAAQVTQFANTAQEAIAAFDFSRPVESLAPYLSGMQAIAQQAGRTFRSLISGAIAFGVASLAGFSPALLVLGGVALVAIAVSTNFLGLRTILLGLTRIVTDVARGFFQILEGAIQVARGIIQIFGSLGAAIRGDFSGIVSGAELAFQGVRGIVGGVGTAITGIFGGAFQIVEGLFQGFRQVAVGTASAIAFAFRAPGATLAFLADTASSVASFIARVFGQAGSGVTGAIAAIGTAARATFTYLSELTSAIAAFLPQSFGRATEAVSNLFHGMGAIAGGSLRFISETVAAVATFFPQAFGRATEGVESTWRSLSGFAQTTFRFIGDTVGAIAAFIPQSFGRASEGVEATVRNLTGFIQANLRLVSDTVGAIANFISQAFGRTAESVEATFRGIGSAAQASFRFVGDTAAAIAQFWGRVFGQAGSTSESAIAGIGTTARGTFGYLGEIATATGTTLSAIARRPMEAWQGFLGLISQIQERLQGLMDAASRTATAVQSKLGGLFGRKQATVAEPETPAAATVITAPAAPGAATAPAPVTQVTAPQLPAAPTPSQQAIAPMVTGPTLPSAPAVSGSAAPMSPIAAPEMPAIAVTRTASVVTPAIAPALPQAPQVTPTIPVTQAIAVPALPAQAIQASAPVAPQQAIAPTLPAAPTLAPPVQTAIASNFTLAAAPQMEAAPTLQAIARPTPALPSPAIAPAAQAALPPAQTNQAADDALENLARTERALVERQLSTSQATNQALGAMGNALSLFAPSLATPIMAASSLISSFDDIKEALPSLKAGFKAAAPAITDAASGVMSLAATFPDAIAGLGKMAAAQLAAGKAAALSAAQGGFASARQGLQSLITAFPSAIAGLGRMAAAQLAAGRAAMVNGNFLGWLRGSISTAVASLSASAGTIGASNTAIAASFTGVKAAAASTWATMIAPALPFLAIIGAVVGGVALLHLAYRRNFLGIGSVVRSVTGAIAAFARGVFGVVRFSVLAAGYLAKFAIAFSPIGVGLFVVSNALRLFGAIALNILVGVGRVAGQLARGFLAPFQPALTAIARFGMGLAQVFGRINQFANRILGVGTTGRAAATGVKQLADSLTAPLRTLGDIAFTVGRLLNPLTLIGGLLTGAANALLFGLLLPFRIVGSVVGGVVSAIAGIAAVVQEIGGLIANLIVKPFEGVGGLLRRFTGAPQAAAAAPEAAIAEPMAASPNRIQSSWEGFGGWFGGAMGGLVDEGKDAGIGLINALNHNPTVKIPIAWELATTRIGGLLGGLQAEAMAVGSRVSETLQPSGAIAALQGAIARIGQQFQSTALAALAFGVTSLATLSPVVLILGGAALAVMAIATNFLGVRTALKGVVQVIGGLLTGVRGVAEVVDGLLRGVMGFARGVLGAIAGIPAALRGDFSQIQASFSQMRADLSASLERLGAGFRTLGQAAEQVFHGLLQVARGVGQGIEQVFGAIAAVFGRLPDSARTATQALGAVFGAIPDTLRGVLAQAANLVDGAIAQIKAGWDRLTAIAQIPVFDHFLASIREIPAIFSAMVERIQALWKGVGDRLSGVMNFLSGKSKETGKDLTANLSENSPGPTFQIRQKWAIATQQVVAQMERMGQHATVAGRQIGDRVGAGIDHMEAKARTGISGVGQHIGAIARHPGIGAMGRSFSSLGMAASNLSPQLAGPLFMFGDLIDTASTLSDSLPEAKSFFTGLLPQAKAFASGAGGALSGFGTKAIALLPVIGGFASSAVASIAAIAAPFLPVIAAIAAVGAAIFLLHRAFQSNFLGIRSLIQGVGAAFGAVGGAIASVGGLITGVILAPLRLVQAIAQGLQSLLSGIGASPLMGLGAGAIATVQGSWEGFGNWFGGAMGNLVTMGGDAGQGLINMLNHNPTVKIPLAWEKAGSLIRGTLSTLVDVGSVVGGRMLSVLGGGISGFGQMASRTLGQVGRQMMMFALSSAVGMAPLLLALGGVALIAIAIGSNFLGLKTIVNGAIAAITGTIQGLVQIVQGVAQTIGGVVQGAIALFKGDFDGVREAARRVGDGIRQAFGGAIDAVEAIFRGMGQVVDGVFEGLEQGSKMLGGVLGSAIANPMAAWKGFMGILDQIEAKVRDVASAIAASPLGKFAQAAGLKVTGKAPTMAAAQDMVDFDQRLAATGPQPVAQTLGQRVEQARQNAVSRVQGAIAPKAAQPDTAAKKTAEDAVSAGDRARESLNGAGDAASSLATLVGFVSPALAGPIASFGVLLSAVTGLATAIPALSAGFVAMSGAIATSGGVVAAVGAGMSTAFTAIAGAASAAWIAITGPLLPIIVGVAAVAVAVGALAIAFRTNFLGIRSLIGGALNILGQFWSALRDGVGAIAGSIQATYQATVGGVLNALAGLGSALLTPFMPLLNLFGAGAGGGGLLGRAIAATVNQILFPFRIIANAIRTVIVIVGAVVQGVVTVATVIAETVLLPLGAVFGAIAEIGSALQGLWAAITAPFRSIQSAVGGVSSSLDQAGASTDLLMRSLRLGVQVAITPLRLGILALVGVIRVVGGAIAGVVRGITLILSLGQFLGSILRGAIAAPFELAGRVIGQMLSMLQGVGNVLLAPFRMLWEMLGNIGGAIARIPVIGPLLQKMGGFLGGGDRGQQSAATEPPTLKFARGGPVPGSGQTDSISAMLMPGEFVLNRLGARTMGAPLLEAANQGRSPLEMMPAPLPEMVPRPIAVPVGGGSGAGAALPPVQVTLNVEGIHFHEASGGGDRNQSRQKAIDLLDELQPHLERAIVDILRDLVDKTK